jgi:hypothetical protein
MMKGLSSATPCARQREQIGQGGRARHAAADAVSAVSALTGPAARAAVANIGTTPIRHAPDRIGSPGHPGRSQAPKGIGSAGTMSSVRGRSQTSRAVRSARPQPGPCMA